MTGILHAILSFFGVQTSSSANYVEDVFSTYLYTGTGAAQTITNGIDLSTKGGLVWVKGRTSAWENKLTDTVRGATKALISNDAGGEGVDSNGLTSFSTTGFVLGSNTNYNWSGGGNYVSWTFREQAKFFDIVTYTGDNSNRTISHNLGSVPGCIFVKSLDTGGWWSVYHRSLGNTKYLILNQNDAVDTGTTFWNSTDPTSTTFSLGTSNFTNRSGDRFVAYLFAHDAGGFGLTGTDNVISCGSFTTDGSGAAGNITLGYESQLVMLKRSDGVGNWQIIDTMRGSSLTSYSYISPTVSSAESSSTSTQGVYPTATGFYVGNNFPGANQTYVYIAIRRGPMKTPSTGTSVFSPVTRTGTGTTAVATYGFAPDLVIPVNRPHDYSGATPWFDKLRGVNQAIYSNTLGIEENRADTFVFSNTGVIFGTNAIANSSSASYINWAFQRAPNFFDEVCYTGDGTTGRQVSHGLAAIPEMIILKQRNGTTEWTVYQKDLGTWAANSPYTLYLQTTTAKQTDSSFIGTAPSSTSFPVSSAGVTNTTSGTYVTYLFATCAGVSKVGSYTGTGALQTINCGFAAGARFVLIKRTDSTGAWYVWDSARGISSSDDPYLLLNSTAAEVTNTNYVDTTAVGFQVTAAAPAAINANGGAFIFLAIA